MKTNAIKKQAMKKQAMKKLAMKTSNKMSDFEIKPLTIIIDVPEPGPEKKKLESIPEREKQKITGKPKLTFIQEEG